VQLEIKPVYVRDAVRALQHAFAAKHRYDHRERILPTTRAPGRSMITKPAEAKSEVTWRRRLSIRPGI